MVIKDWFAKLAALFPHSIAVKAFESGRAFTYSELNSRAINLAVNQGFKAREVISVLSPWTIDLPVMMAAAQKSGACLAPLNYRLGLNELKTQIAILGPQRLYYHPHFKALAEGLAGFSEVSQIQPIDEDLFTENQEGHFELWTKGDEPLFLFFTSGSSGIPKAVIYSHEMLYHNAVNTLHRLGIASSDTSIAFMPPYHSGGWNVMLTPFWYAGATVVLLPSFDEEQVFEAIQAAKSCMMMAVPTMLRKLAAHPHFSAAQFSGLKGIISGGEPIDTETYSQWKAAGVNIRQGYGLTECGPSITSLPEGNFDNIRSVGTPNFGIDVRIVNEEGNDCRPMEPGEVWIAGPVITPGYWLFGAVEILENVGGYFPTQDMAYRDEQGLIYLLGRKGHMYIRGGENVYPVEVEKVLENHPDIKQAVVMGVEHRKWGQVGVAFIVPKPGHALYINEITDYCEANLAAYKRPERLISMEAIPALPSGKTDYLSLQLLLHTPHRA